MKSANKKRSRLEGVAAAHVILQAFQEIFLGAIDFTQTLGDFDGYQSWMYGFKGKLKQHEVNKGLSCNISRKSIH
jgi:hypothetical protein